MTLTGRFRSFRIAATEITQPTIRFIRYTALADAFVRSESDWSGYEIESAVLVDN
jgi:hypothetical protein